jgi:dihydroorotase
MPADITIFKVTDGKYSLEDCKRQRREANTRFDPVMVFKNGRRIDCDVTLCQDDRNWFLQIAEDHIPEAASGFSSAQRAFLADLGKALSAIDWGIYAPERLDLSIALKLQAAFHAVRQHHGLGLKDALMAVFDSFLDSPFTMQVGLFLLRQERSFALERISAVGRELSPAH